MTDKHLPCPGADDPEERCPRHPKDCTCWQIDPDHPSMKQPAPPADIDRLMKETLFAALKTGRQRVEYGGVLTDGGKARITFEVRPDAPEPQNREEQP